MTDATKSLITKISDRYKEKTNEKSKTRDSSGFNRYDVNYIYFYACSFSWNFICNLLLYLQLLHISFYMNFFVHF